MRYLMFALMLVIGLAGCAKDRVFWNSNGKMQPESSRKVWDSNGKIDNKDRKVWDRNGKMQDNNNDRKIWVDSTGHTVID